MSDPVVAAFAIVVIVVLPLLAIQGSIRLGNRPLPPRRALYLETLLIQLVLMIAALGVARRSGIDLWRARAPDAIDLLVTALAVAAALGTIPLRWRASAPDRRTRLLALVPHTPSERALWVLVSAAAGIGEEIVYRGVLFAILARMFPGWWLAALISAAAFAGAHALQGWRSSVYVGLFGLGFQLLVRLTGMLYLAMLAHFVYDLVAGPVIARLGRSRQPSS